MTVAAMLLYDNEGEDAWRQIRKEKSCEQILSDICGLDPESDSGKRILSYYNKFINSRNDICFGCME